MPPKSYAVKDIEGMTGLIQNQIILLSKKMKLNIK